MPPANPMLCVLRMRVRGMSRLDGLIAVRLDEYQFFTANTGSCSALLDDGPEDLFKWKQKVR
jgi:hypothetical protein